MPRFNDTQSNRDSGHRTGTSTHPFASFLNTFTSSSTRPTTASSSPSHVATTTAPVVSSVTPTKPAQTVFPKTVASAFISVTPQQTIPFTNLFASYSQDPVYGAVGFGPAVTATLVIMAIAMGISGFVLIFTRTKKAALARTTTLFAKS